MKSLVIIPTYNEKENIENIIRKVISLDANFHVLIVDDGSPDGTAAIIQSLQNEQDRLVNGVRLEEGIVFLLNHLHQGSNEMISISEQFSACINELQTLSKLDTTLYKTLEKSLAITIDLESIIIDLEQYLSKRIILTVA